MTLVILAAGMGSRYGGLKQIDPITENGEFIIDFSVYDAILNGFDKIVFVIKEENLDEFKDTIGKRFENKIKVEYAFQDLADLPEGFSVPEGRTKPWGTAQALLAARNIVNEPFAVINSDDFYGRSAYSLLASHLGAIKNMNNGEYCMIGYILQNTLTENGTVSRGICDVGEDGYLTEVTERTAIRREGDVAVFNENGKDYEISLESIASMNCWGFTPDIFEHVEKGFTNFLSELKPEEIKKEYYLPGAVCELMKKGLCTVRVYPSRDAWYGVTYASDKAAVQKGIGDMIADGTYPKILNA